MTITTMTTSVLLLLFLLLLLFQMWFMVPNQKIVDYLSWKETKKVGKITQVATSIPVMSTIKRIITRTMMMTATIVWVIDWWSSGQRRY